jgi:hypothetical protein
MALAMLRLAADENFDNDILRGHVSTITKYAYERVRGGLAMPGVFEVAADAPVGRIIDDILMIVECSLPEEWAGQVRYLPL